MSSRLLTCAAAAVGAFVLATAPQPARADWLRAESERFIVYSDGGERALRDYVQKLETFDRVMRYRSGLPISEAPSRKLPIYLVGSRNGLLRVNPSTDRNVVGTYFPTDEDIFAVALRGENDEILLHEYVHHFMMANMPAAYPGWFIEGFAEYYMTADIDPGKIQIGGFSDNRAYWLVNGTWIPLETLLRSRPGEITRSAYRETYYPVAWLLTHWFFSDAERQAQLSAYLNEVIKGGDPVEAMETATGMKLSELQTELRRYMTGRITVRNITGSAFPAVDVAVTRLPRAANDLLLINQRLKIGVPDEDREALGRQVAQLATRHGDDPLALLAAGHAGMHFGDRTAGEAALQKLIALEPDDVEALQFLAQERLRQSRDAEDDAARLALKREARAYLARAYVADANDYRTLMLLGELRNGEAGYPNENDLLTLGLAFDRAPQLPGVRIAYAQALILKGEKEEAITLLEPLANNPHGGGAADYAQQIIDALKAGEEAPPAPETLDDPEPVEPETPPESAPAPASE